MQYVSFCSIKGYLLQKDIAKDQTKNNFIRNSSLVTSGFNFLKDNILRRDELRFKLTAVISRKICVCNIYASRFTYG